MSESVLSWDEIKSLCPVEALAIMNLLDEYDVRLNSFLRAVSDDIEWHDAIDIRDMHLEISEIEEARLEESLVSHFQGAWTALTDSFQQATEDDGLCKVIKEIVFSNEHSFNEEGYFRIELTRSLPRASALVKKGESSRCEFKSTLRVNLHTGQNDKKMEHSCLKTIAAFLNSHGGHLIVGVSDSGEVFGIEKDGFPNEDSMNLHLVNLIKDRMGAHHMLYIESQFETLNDKRVLVMRCKPSEVPVFVKDGNTEQFFTRTGAATVELLPSQIQTYIKQRF